MTKRENKVTPFQMFVLIVQTQIGVSILSLPSSIFQKANTDGWISMLIAGAISQILVIVIWLLNTRFKESTIFVISRKILGKWLGTFVIIAYIAYFCATASIILILFTRMISLWVLPRTPYWTLMVLLLAVGMDMARENLRVLARFCTFLLILLVMFLFFIFYGFKDAQYINILPIGHAGFFNILLGSKKATLSVLGFEMVLVIYPFVQGTPKQKLKAASLANLFVTLFYTLTILSVYFYFTPALIHLLPEPVLYMLKAFKFTIIERVDLLFISVWIVIVASSFMTYLYLASVGFSDLFKKKKHSRFVPLAALFAFVPALYPNQNEITINKLNEFFEQVSVAFVAVIPFVLLLIAYLFGKKEKRLES